jgi:hypothetical protein
LFEAREGLPQIAPGVGEYRPRDNQALDFAGALVDVEDAPVSEASIQRMVFRHRLGAEQIDASLGNPSRGVDAGFDTAYSYKPLHHPLGHAFAMR